MFQKHSFSMRGKLDEFLPHPREKKKQKQTAVVQDEISRRVKAVLQFKDYPSWTVKVTLNSTAYVCAHVYKQASEKDISAAALPAEVSQ